MQYMEANDLTEEEYIDQATQIYKKSLIISKFYEVLSEEKGSINTEEYTSDLLGRANVVYAK